MGSLTLITHTHPVTMSWSSYIDNLLQNEHIAAAGIFGLDGSKWASSPGFEISADEIKKINFADPSALYATGARIGGEKYLMLRSPDTGVIYVKKGTAGCCLCKPTQAVIVCKYTDGMNAGSCNDATEKMKTYLQGAGY